MQAMAGEILSVEELTLRSDELRALGRRLVLTNGCFDLLHTGHARYLRQAREQGDALAVAVNADASVRKLKGPTRPLNGEKDRAEILAALRFVDFVTIFPEERATRVIEQVRPSIYVKGGDYTPESLDAGEVAALKACGAQIVILPLVPGRSTSSLIDRSRQAE